VHDSEDGTDPQSRSEALNRSRSLTR